MSISLVFGLFGLIVGSFLNVLIGRWGVRALSGRSTCDACGRVIAWYDLIPVLSWFMLRGRCRFCGSRLSFQYVLVEATSGLLFALIGASPLELASQLFALPIAALLIAIFVYDLHHTLIPDAWVWTLNALALASVFLLLFTDYFSLLTILAGPLIAAPLFVLWWYSRGAWMGFGDVKLALSIGWLLGMGGGLQALFLAFVLGALASAPLLFFSSDSWKRMQMRFTPIRTSPTYVLGFTMKSEIPFGPFLVASCFVIWFIEMYGIALPFSLL